MSDLLFLVSKAFQALIQPDFLIVIAVCCSTALLWWRLRLGRWLATASAIILLVTSVLPIGHWLLLPLEERFQRPSPSEMGSPDGIIVLGGAVQPRTTQYRGVLATNGYAERLIEMIILARQFPAARIVFTGGTGSIRAGEPTEAEMLAPYLTRMGLPQDRVVLEGKSRNTYENANETMRAIQPNPGETWLLVTSAAHMPRAAGVFRQAGLQVLPWPVDYHTSGAEPWPALTPVRHWQALWFAAHEYIGLVSYYLAGYSASLFPGPQEDK